MTLTTNPGLTFDEATHTYTLRGRRVPNVTSILEPLHPVGWGRVQNMELGRAVHLACHYADLGDLDPDLDDKLRPYLAAWEMWKSKAKFTVLASEVPIAHEVWWYACTPDKYGRLGKESAVVELKTGEWEPIVYGAQTAPQQRAIEARTGKKCKLRIGVVLRGDGTYVEHECTDPTDWQRFMSCLTVFNAKERMR